MFFHISKTQQNNFPNHHQTKHFVISLDDGWSQIVDQNNNNIWYKGYLDDDLLDHRVVEISNEEIPSFNGNFCIIKVFDQGISIRSSRLRSFPIWYNSTVGLTNLQNIGEVFWADSVVMLKNNMEILHAKFDVIGDINPNLLDIDSVTDQVDRLLDSKIKKFLSIHTNPIKIFLSGGIDTTFVFSYIQKHTSNYEIIAESHVEYDYFYLKNHGYLKQLWGYNQIHHWRQPAILSSGAPGDEFSCRNPITVDFLLKYHGTSFVETMEDSRFKNNSLNYNFFKKNYLEKLLVTPTYENLTQAIYKGCDYNVNDWQHWHLGRTLTYTPLRDIEMFKLYARLEVDALKEQLMNSVIQIKLIGKNNPKLLNTLSTQKNELNYMQNLTEFLV
jgi:hypothetical protein